MPRQLMLALILVVVSLLPGPGPANQAGALRPVALATNQPLDLPAMTLRPGDLERIGIGGFNEFGVKINRLVAVDLEEEATYITEMTGDSRDEVLAALADAGANRRYEMSYYPVDTDGSPIRSTASARNPAMSVWVEITEYASAEGASAVLALLRNESADRGFEDVPGTRQIGDESKVTRWEGMNQETGTPVQGIEVTFREGNLVGMVMAKTYGTQVPVPDHFEDLASVLRARMVVVREAGGPGLSRLVSRPVPTGNESEVYLLVEGQFMRRLGTMSNTGTALSQLYGGATDLYVYDVALNPTAKGLQDSARYRVILARLPDPAAAAAWVTGPDLDELLSDQSFELLGAVDENRPIGTAYRVFSSYNAYADGLVHSGYVVVTHVDNLIAQITVSDVRAVDLSEVRRLAEAQAACLKAAGVCPPIDLPASLQGPR